MQIARDRQSPACAFGRPLSARWMSSSRRPRVSTPWRASRIAESAIGVAIASADSGRSLSSPRTPAIAPRIPPNFELAATMPLPVARSSTG
jgi:hypothetical protein